MPVKKEVTGHLVVWEGATRIDLMSRFKMKQKNKGGGIRGEIKGGFSRQSRQRLFKLLNSIREDAYRKALFVTLTYKRTHVEPEEAKRNLRAFVASLRRRNANCSGIWKLEFQKRGSPHYHVIIFARWLDHRWVAETWNRIAEHGDPDHLAAGTQVVAVKASKSTVAYVGKYMAKLEDGQPSDAWGRFWGVFGRKALPLGQPRIVELYGDHPRRLIGLHAKKVAGNDGDNYGKISVYTRSTKELQKIISDEA